MQEWSRGLLRQTKTFLTRIWDFGDSSYCYCKAQIVLGYLENGFNKNKRLIKPYEFMLRNARWTTIGR